jgi:tetratricopeptide (TPR) repeat protein
MSRIVISDDKSLENLEIRFDHLLLNKDELQQEKERYKPLSDLLDDVPDDFVPTLLIQKDTGKLQKVLEGNDELELFFMIMVLKEKTSDIFQKLKSLKSSLDPDKYLDLLIFILVHDKSLKDDVLNEIKSLSSIPSDGVTDLIISSYSDHQHEIKSPNDTCSYSALFFEALKAENNGETDKAFSMFLTLFEKSGYHSFIYEILKLYLIQYNDIESSKINEFIKKIGESSLNVSFSNLKFLEFMYYYRNNIEDKIESTVSSLAESTDSLYILSVVSPLLFKYEKWHLVGKYYKLIGRKTSGGERTKYLELLADIYENKLDMPDFATEIHKTIVEDDPMSCSISLSRVLSVYEENGQWRDLCDLYRYLADREESNSLKAYYLYKAGDVMHRELKNSTEAKSLLEKSLSFNHSFEVVRTLSEIYLKLHDYDSYLTTLLKELEFSLDKNERIRLLNIIAETYMDKKKDFLSAEKYLLNILEISELHLPTIKKLGKIYYRTRSWKKLTEINNRELNLINDLSDKVNLYYRNGYIYFKELGDMANAAECFMKILEIETDHVPSLLYLEKIYLREKDFTNLIVLYKKLLHSSGSDSETRQYYLTRLAIIYRDNKMVEEAVGMFEKVLELFPENIMAKENLRMLSQKADFSVTSSSSFDDREIEMFAELQERGDPGIIKKQYLERSEESFWKHLYFVWKSDASGVEKPRQMKLTSDEQFVLSILEGEFQVENLLKNSSKRIALMTLVEKYIEEGYYRGVYTVLKYYLNYEPEHKRKVWAVFFRGQDNPDLKEDLENILVNDTDNTYFDIVREILEKLYLKEENYSTVIFLRTVFAKKINDDKERCRFIDESINEFSGKAPSEQMLDLYKLRFKSTEDDGQLVEFAEKYVLFLETAGKQSLVIPTYEELWIKIKTVDIGKKFFEKLCDSGQKARAVEIAKDILNIEWDISFFEKLISIYKEREEFDAAIAEINLKMDTLKEDGCIEKLSELLTDIHISAGYIESAMELFNKTDFADPVEKFDKGFELAELLGKSGHKEDSLQLVEKLHPVREKQAVKRIEVLISSGYELKDEYLLNIETFKELENAIGEDVIEPHRERLVDFFAERGDTDSARKMVERLIEEGNKEQAAAKIKSFGFESYDEAVFNSKIASKEEDRSKEKEILLSILFKSFLIGDSYPSKRLAELEKNNKKGLVLSKCFLRSISGDDQKCESTGISSIDREQLFNFCEFDETDKAIREYASIVSLGGREEIKIVHRPFDNNSQRILFNLLEEIRLATGFEDVKGFWDDKFNGLFEVIPAKVPVFIFGERTVSSDWKTVKFDIIRNAFLIECGMRKYSGIRGLEEMVERLSATLKLEGKEKVRFIKNLRPALQNRILELFNLLEPLPDEKFYSFIKKLHTASFFHAFSFAPDINAIPVYLEEPISFESMESEQFGKVNKFIDQFFFNVGEQ